MTKKSTSSNAKLWKWKTIYTKIIFQTCLLCLIRLIHPALTFASTDPQYATPSATATVPSSTPTTGDTTAPTPPILIRPEDGTYSSDNKREFVWQMSTDDNSNTIFYTLYLNGIATYLGVSGLGNSTGFGYSSIIDGNYIRLTPTVALADGEYDWHVTASDLSQNTSSSTTWHLTIDTEAPPLTLIDLDSFHHPTVVEGSNFDIAGPKDVYLKLETVPYGQIQLNIDQGLPLIYQTQADGYGYFYPYLTPGIYTFTLMAIDRSGNYLFLPDFTVTITQASIEIPIPQIPGITTPITPPSSPPPSAPPKVISIPYTPLSLPSLPATISRISTGPGLPNILYTLLALALIPLLFILFKRRANLYLFDADRKPLDAATIYHSNPSHASSKESIVYYLSSTDHGKLFIRNLSRFSTLTINCGNNSLILSLCRPARKYKLFVE